MVTGNGTFSAAIMFAAMLKYYGKDQAIFVGEPAGDNLTFWANGGAPMKLPNSEIEVRIWTSFNDWENRCRDWHICFLPDIFDSVPAGSVEPAVISSLRYDNYIEGKDTALETISNLEG